MQDMVGGDNNRTPAIFQVPDIYRFVGEITAFQGQDLCQKSSVSLEMYQPPYIVYAQINFKRGLMVVVFVVTT